ncbi:MAG: DUF1349 domain-containing protein [Planctomycetes bacterium]|nr:DUF1349 domain-containing protein [Planctomycetota bacterium]
MPKVEGHLGNRGLSKIAMRRALLLLLLASSGAGAAPVPKDAAFEEQLLMLYGTRTDEKKQAQFTPTANRLTIRVKKAEGIAFHNAVGAPRVMREVTGDFLARVAVALPLFKDESDVRDRTITAGGFVVVFGKEHNLQFDRSHEIEFKAGKWAWMNRWNVNSRRPREDIVRHSTSFPATDKPVYLSLARQGKKFTAEHSADGKKWELIHSVEESAPEKVLLGLFATHDRNETLDIVFSDYSVVAPKK